MLVSDTAVRQSFDLSVGRPIGLGVLGCSTLEANGELSADIGMTWTSPDTPCARGVGLPCLGLPLGMPGVRRKPLGLCWAVAAIHDQPSNNLFL